MPTSAGKKWNTWRYSCNRFISLALNSLKWPIGIIKLFLSPAALLAIIDIAETVPGNWIETVCLLSGMIVYLLIRNLLLGERSWIRTLEVFHHEFIHALAAILSFGTISEIYATRSKGGHVAYRGRGNWVITLAPWFLPLFPLSMACMSIILIQPFSYISLVLTGIGISFYYLSLINDARMHQPDLIKIGLPFLAIFLIPINVILFHLTILIGINGSEGFVMWGEILLRNSYEFYLSKF